MNFRKVPEEEVVALNVILHSLQPEVLGVDFSALLGLMVGENPIGVCKNCGHSAWISTGSFAIPIM